MKLTDYLSRNTISKPEPIERYDEECVINCILPLLEFFSNYGNITGKLNSEARTDQIRKCEQKFNQSASSKMNEPKYVANKTNKRSSLLPQLNTVNQSTINILQTNHETTMVILICCIEQNETDDPSEGTTNKPLERSGRTRRIKNV